ncbi:MAG: hypothetical protein ACOH5I_03680 [Oligoflexus sp.]
MKRMVVKLFVLFVISACQSTLVPISKRPIDSYGGSGQYIRKSRSIEQDQNQEKEELFLRQQDVRIVAREEPDVGASLFQLDNPQNYLFYDKPRGDPGDVLNVFVRSSNTPTDEASTAAANPGGAELSPEQLEQDLLAALPQLTPGEDKPPMITKIPFKVMRRLANGDAIVEYFRSSKNQTESNAIKIQARLPRHILQSNKAILTSDLRDVSWYQNQKQQLTERQSLNWEDEYTLRLSGFEEAKSQEALQLESKRKELVQLRDRLRQRIISLGQEKQLVVKERDRVGQMKNEIEKKIGDLESEVRDRETKLEEQRQLIQRQEQTIRGLQQAGDEVEEVADE